MSVKIKPAFRTYFGPFKGPTPLSSFPDEISVFAAAAYRDTVLARETEQRENDILRQEAIDKRTRVLVTSKSIEQQELEKVKHLLDKRPTSDRIPPKSKHSVTNRPWRDPNQTQMTPRQRGSRRLLPLLRRATVVPPLKQHLEMIVPVMDWMIGMPKRGKGGVMPRVPLARQRVRTPP